jgi:DNA-binding XRE family transcriptional regulator
MAENSSQLRRRSAAVFRSARKGAGFTQQDLAKILGIRQGTISKIEDGQLLPDLFAWLHLAELVQIPERSIERGYIDGLRVTPISIQESRRVGRFKIPPRYAHHQGTSVKISKPAVIFAEQRLSREEFESLFDELRVDPDYFTDLRHLLNTKFTWDLYEKLIARGVLKRDDVEYLADIAGQPECNGNLLESYASSTTLEELVTVFRSNYRYYDVEHAMAVEGTSTRQIDLVFKARDQAASFEVTEETYHFAKQYKESYFSKFFSKWLGKAVSALCENPIANGAMPCVIHLQN